MALGQLHCDPVRGWNVWLLNLTKDLNEFKEKPEENETIT